MMEQIDGGMVLIGKRSEESEIFSQVRWCRGQDLNLRTTEDWDLNPAPLTKLGNPCLVPAPILTA